jgi:hypothetical protein
VHLFDNIVPVAEPGWWHVISTLSLGSGPTLEDFVFSWPGSRGACAGESW